MHLSAGMKHSGTQPALTLALEASWSFGGGVFDNIAARKYAAVGPRVGRYCNFRQVHAAILLSYSRFQIAPVLSRISAVKCHPG